MILHPVVIYPAREASLASIGASLLVQKSVSPPCNILLSSVPPLLCFSSTSLPTDLNFSSQWLSLYSSAKLIKNLLVNWLACHWLGTAELTLFASTSSTFQIWDSGVILAQAEVFPPSFESSLNSFVHWFEWHRPWLRRCLPTELNRKGNCFAENHYLNRCRCRLQWSGGSRAVPLKRPSSCCILGLNQRNFK